MTKISEKSTVLQFTNIQTRDSISPTQDFQQIITRTSLLITKSFFYTD